MNQLAQRSRTFENRLRAANATLGEVQDAMSPRDCLLEFRRYRPVVGPQSGKGERWALLAVQGRKAEPQLIDAGLVSDSTDAIGKLLNEQPGSGGDEAAAALFSQLFGKLPADLLKGRRIWIATDGQLALVPFGRLRLADGSLWVAGAELHFIETGRELLPRYAEPKPGSGLIAFGDIDFGRSQRSPSLTPNVTPPKEPPIISATLTAGSQPQRATQTLRSAGLSFGALPETAKEVIYIAALYQTSRPREVAARVLRTTAASKATLDELLSHHAPPRALHLATHGFFLPDQSPIDRPLLKAGVALAGANTGAEGILYAIEAQGLDLEGTELVTLSACETARGSVDYAEGVEGLVQAFHTAGARWVLVSLRTVGDHIAREFMSEFYESWLAQPHSDPAVALQGVQKNWATSQDSDHSNPANWAPWIIVGG